MGRKEQHQFSDDTIEVMTLEIKGKRIEPKHHR